MKFNKQVLSNGLKVITVPMADNPSVTVLVMVEAGSKYETREISGISHFLEHMVFKGTPRRPKASEISRELDSIGAHYNAFTSQEFTGYYAKADARHLDLVLDIIGDMYVNPLFDEKEMSKEKGVIIEELRMYRDLPQQHVHDLVAEILHGDTPAGWSVIGNEQTINGFTRDALVKYRSEHYVSGATTVIVAGSIDEKSMISKIEKVFGQISHEPKKNKISVNDIQTKPAARAQSKETDQTHLVLAIRTFDINDPRISTMQVLSTILGGGMSSRLFSKLRDELGLCYYVRASHNAFTDHGDLTISAGVDNARVTEAVKVILAECKRLSNETIPPEELKKAKDYIAGTTMLELETSEARAEFAGFQELVKGDIENPETIISKTGAVTAADVQKLAQEIFVDKGLNIALVGRTTEKDLLPLLAF